MKPPINYVRSSLWPGIKGNLQTVLSNSTWQIGDGRSTNFSLDKWLSHPLVDLLQIPSNLQNHLMAIIADFIKDNSWSIPTVLLVKSPEIGLESSNLDIPIFTASYQLIWQSSSTGNLTFKDAFSYLKPVQNRCSWSNLI